MKNRGDILEMARKAGFGQHEQPAVKLSCIEEFARLIAEDCAKRCDAIAEAFDESLDPGHACGADACAVEIREAYKP